MNNLVSIQQIFDSRKSKERAKVNIRSVLCKLDAAIKTAHSVKNESGVSSLLKNLYKVKEEAEVSLSKLEGK